jgi:hypothetical protein
MISNCSGENIWLYNVTSGIGYHTANSIINNNSTSYGLYFYNSHNCNITTLYSRNNNITGAGIYIYQSHNNHIGTIKEANNSATQGAIASLGHGNTIDLIEHLKYNGTYGVYFSSANENYIGNIQDAGGNTSAIYNGGIGNKIGGLTTDGTNTASIVNTGTLYIRHATIGETPIITAPSASASFANYRANIEWDAGYSTIYTDGGLIESQASTLANGSGTEWKFTTTTNKNREVVYPLNMIIARIACEANKEVTVKCWCKKGHATDIGARINFAAQLGAGTQKGDKADNTNEEELSLAFTPTETGVAEIEAWAYINPSAVKEDVVFSLSGVDDVLGTYVGHGLSNGDTVSINGLTNALANTNWVVTVINADTFTVNGASWATQFTGADVTGDVVRHSYAIFDQMSISQA